MLSRTEVHVRKAGKVGPLSYAAYEAQAQILMNTNPWYVYVSGGLSCTRSR